MCFYKTKESKVLMAKRGIKVYKIGAYANKSTFMPFFYSDFSYPVNQLVIEPVIFADSIEYGLHSYLNCILYPLYPAAVDLYTQGNLRYTLSLLQYSIFLGEFLIPAGTLYCLNSNGEVVSNRLIYTGNYIKIQPYKEYDTRELWKEK
mgnify:CR=1 FL=1